LIDCLFIAAQELRFRRYRIQILLTLGKLKCGKILTMMHFEKPLMAACWILGWYRLFLELY